MHKLRWLHERFHGFTDCWFIYMIATLQLLKCKLPKHPPCWSRIIYKADSRLAPSQRETSLQSNAVSHWLGTSLDIYIYIYICVCVCVCVCQAITTTVMICIDLIFLLPPNVDMFQNSPVRGKSMTQCNTMKYFLVTVAANDLMRWYRDADRHSLCWLISNSVRYKCNIFTPNWFNTIYNFPCSWK